MIAEPAEAEIKHYGDKLSGFLLYL